MRMPVIAWQKPLVGSALNWQGQPQEQLQLAISGPCIRQLIYAMACLPSASER
jgi:hypothetical protein